jgi:transposase
MPRKRSRVRFSKAPEVLQPNKHPDAAGIDIASAEAVVAVPLEKVKEGAPVRTFSLYSQGLYELRDWLQACGVRTVAMESTGNYWICLYEVLEEAGIDVWLVHAQHVQAVPGRKTDVCDAQWLQQLHACGLLRKAFRPGREVVGLRYVMRHRAGLLQRGSQALQAMQKTLVECNLRVHHVLSDLDGESGQRIIAAILGGEQRPEVLADLCDRRCRTPKAEVIEALRGHYRAEYLFVLRQDWENWQAVRAAIKACDEQLAELVGGCAAGPLPAPEPEQPLQRTRAHKNSFAFDLSREAWRFYEVDLCTIPGISASTVAVLMSEIGPRTTLLEHFKSAQAFSSWLCLCPQNRITGGKVLSAKTRPSRHRLSAALRMAAMALGHAHDTLGDYCRRMKARLGKAEGITVVAHKLARMIYQMIATRQNYDEAKAFYVTPQKRSRQIAELHKKAARYGFALAPLGPQAS